MGHARLQRRPAAPRTPSPAGRAAAVPFATSALALTTLAAHITSAIATTATLFAARAAAASPPATIASDGALALSTCDHRPTRV